LVKYAYNFKFELILEQTMGYFRENIEKAKGYEPGFQPKQADVVKLNTNENPYPPSPEVMKVLAEIGPEQLRRYPDPIHFIRY
jgi:histidinol-phosphate aminotransferase